MNRNARTHHFIAVPTTLSQTGSELDRHPGAQLANFKIQVTTTACPTLPFNHCHMRLLHSQPPALWSIDGKRLSVGL